MAARRLCPARTAFRLNLNPFRHRSLAAEILEQLKIMTINTQALSDAVAANTEAVADATAEIQSLISGSGEQAAQAAIDAATSTIQTNTAQLTAAIPPAPVQEPVSQ